MILLDYSAVAIANIMIGMKRDKEQLNKEFALHTILNSIRKSNVMFRREFGRMVLCCDDIQNWRQREFEFYKWKRKKNKENSDIDWNFVYECLDYTKDSIDAGFPYNVIQVFDAEADDIIGCLARYATVNEIPTVIVSNDKDFIQLHGKFVCQYRPIEEGFVRNQNPERFLREMIIRGDSDDGIPNIKCPDNQFTIEGARQTSIYKKDVDVWVHDDKLDFLDDMDTKHIEDSNKKNKKRVKQGNKEIPITSLPSTNYIRNEKLIDLRFTPPDIEQVTVHLYESNKVRASMPVMTKFFIENRLRYLFEKIKDFM